MDRRKRKQRNILKIKNQLFQVTHRLETIYEKYNIEGVKKIVLSEETRIEVGCLAGDTFTVEEPWNYVEKDRILDHLEEHSNSSEFLSLKKLIENYPEEKILMGSDRAMENKTEEFFICTTVFAKEQIVNILQAEKERKRRMTKKKLSKFIREWHSLGSETDVEDAMLKNFRELYAVEINSDYPISQSRVNFNLRLVQDSINGYVEFIPGRFSFTNVHRKRVDSATQVTPLRVTTEVQTNFLVPINSATQYEYLYDDNLLGRDLELVESLRFFLRRHKANIFDSIKLNNSINFYLNDYEQHAHLIRKGQICSPEALFSVSEVIKCKDMKVTCVSWHPMISGIIAVAYTQMQCYQTEVDFMEKSNASKVDQEHLVLIWSYRNQLKPLLTLVAFRPVKKLSFCPHDGNILIGGCTNGQIVLWDLMDKLQLYRTVELFHNDKQQRIKIGMYVDISWWNNTIDETKLYPTAVSNMNYSHMSEISDIGWISPDYKIDSKGRFTKSEEKSKQFATSSTDSVLLIWNLNLKKRLFGQEQILDSRMARRVSLFGVGSPYKVLHTVFRPIYKIILNAPKKTKGCLLQNISVPVFNIKYVPDNAETQSHFIKHTFFRAEMIEHAPAVEPNLIFTTSMGTLIHLEWEGYDFDPGLLVNFENTKYLESQAVHDGPIRSCEQHCVYKDILLTVGGRVFAVWNEHDKIKPIMWRKCLVPYVSGMWSPQNTCHVIIARRDSCLEVWNLHEQTKIPTKIIRCPGNMLVDIYSESGKRHVQKGTFIISDVRGLIRLYLVRDTEMEISDSAKQIAKKLFDIFEAKQDYFKLIILKSMGIPQRIITEEPPQRPVDEIKNLKKVKQGEKIEPVDQLTKQKYMQREEKQMYELMLKKKNINLSEIETFRGPIQKMYDDKRRNDDKLDIIKLQQEGVIKGAIHSLAVTDKYYVREKQTDIKIPTGNIPQIKKTYIEDYQIMEPDILRFIRINRYSFKFNWNEMVSSSIERYKLGHRSSRGTEEYKLNESDNNMND